MCVCVCNNICILPLYTVWLLVSYGSICFSFAFFASEFDWFIVSHQCEILGITCALVGITLPTRSNDFNGCAMCVSNVNDTGAGNREKEETMLAKKIAENTCFSLWPLENRRSLTNCSRLLFHFNFLIFLEDSNYFQTTFSGFTTKII